jgi:hypothetical protein
MIIDKSSYIGASRWDHPEKRCQEQAKRSEQLKKRRKEADEPDH